MSLGGAVTDGRMGGARREGGLQLLWGRDQTPSASEASWCPTWSGSRTRTTASWRWRAATPTPPLTASAPMTTPATTVTPRLPASTAAGALTSPT